MTHPSITPPSLPFNKFGLDLWEGKIVSLTNDRNDGKLHILTNVLESTPNGRWELLYVAVYNPPEAMEAFEGYLLFHRGSRYLLSLDLKDNKVSRWTDWPGMEEEEPWAILTPEQVNEWVESCGLEGRTNVVLSRGTEPLIRSNLSSTSVHCLKTKEQVYELAHTFNQPLWIIGGGEIYRLFLEDADRIEETLILSGDIQGDTLAPLVDPKKWLMQSTGLIHPVKAGDLPCQFRTHTRMLP